MNGFQKLDYAQRTNTKRVGIALYLFAFGVAWLCGSYILAAYFDHQSMSFTGHRSDGQAAVICGVRGLMAGLIVVTITRFLVRGRAIGLVLSVLAGILAAPTVAIILISCCGF